MFPSVGRFWGHPDLKNDTERQVFPLCRFWGCPSPKNDIEKRFLFYVVFGAAQTRKSTIIIQKDWAQSPTVTCFFDVVFEAARAPQQT